MPKIGIDVGTSFIVSAKENNGNIEYKDFRDAFYIIKPTTPVASKMIEKGLNGKIFIKDNDGSFVLLGKDAIEKAVERNDNAKRPMYKGVVSAKEKDAKRILAFILKEVAGTASEPGEKLVFCVPAQPVDMEDEDFDIGYHEDVLKSIFAECGYDAKAINEAEAICYAELENDDYTGIAVSCLVPGTKIYTNRGILNIEDVKIGDKVITHKGRWKPITNIITKEFSGISTGIQLQGYSNDCNDYKFVDNHELYVYRNNKWQWIGCDSIRIGDIVGEPILSEDKSNPKILYINYSYSVTSSKKKKKKHICVGPNLHRLLGYFLGDGSINKSEQCVQFDFANTEKENIEDVCTILEKTFNKKPSITKKGENCTRIKMYNTGFMHWIDTHMYDENRIKVYPWDIKNLTKLDCLNLLSGLIRSDGWYRDVGFAFGNTTTRLIILARQLCSRLGFPTSINWRKPRSAQLKDGRTIKGKKDDWTISVNNKLSTISISDYIKNVTCDSYTMTERLFIMDNFCCTRVQNIETNNYQGVVYDLQVEEDHSFSGPYLTIHNCGSGMQNICVMLNGEPTVKLSTVRSGDWIDRMSAVATGEKDTVVQAEKEGGEFIIGESNDNPILAAVSAYYERLIDYTTKQLSAALTNHKSLSKFKSPLKIVVAGGTSLAKGYVETFHKKLLENNFPLPIKEVVHASDPLHSVAKGCLIASQVL